MRETLLQAFQRVLTLDAETFAILWLSLKIAVAATVMGLVLAVPLAWFIYRRSSKAKTAMMLVMQTWLAVPTVIIGTLVYLFISRSGPLGALEMLYTPMAIVVGDLILVTPLIAVFLVNAFEQVPKGLVEAAQNLGASSLHLFSILLRECRRALAVAACAGFGRVIAEVGCAMMLGGNIRYTTRTMTTAIALEIGKGETDLGLALGILLLFLALVNAALVQGLQWYGARSRRAAGTVVRFDDGEEAPDGSDLPETAEPNAPIGAVTARPSPPEPEVASREAATHLPGQVRISFDDVAMEFPGRVLFEHLSAEIRPGRGLALTGPSGSGKTTILRLICGLVRPSRGVVRLEGGAAILVFQRPHLFPGTVRENLEFGLWCRGMEKADRRRRAESLAVELGLSAMLDRSIEGLSGGEAARVSLGRALAVEPSLLLLDEPMVHLDRASREAMIRVLRKWQSRGGELLLVTHDPALVTRLCRGEMGLQRGRLVPAQNP